MMGVRITDRDRGAKAVKRLLKQAGERGFTVGIHEKEGRNSHPESPNVTISQVGEFNEFGTQRTPQRSFVRAWADERSGVVARHLRDELALGIRRRSSQSKKVIQETANFAAEDMQDRILAGIAPGNAPATLERKISGIPLLDSNAMFDSIRGKVLT